MNAHKVTVVQTEPDGHTSEFTLDVLASTVDLALERVYGWYNRVNEYLENGNDAAITLHTNIPIQESQGIFASVELIKLPTGESE